ncbi:MAG: PVC-type heme-binding CxxCH protein, partial [Pirellula sp.]
VSFLQGGGSSPETRVEIVDFKTNEVIARSFGQDAEAMKRAVLRLDRAVGSDVFIRLIDNNKDGWGHINFDDFRIHADEPKIASAQRLPSLDKLTYKSLPPDKVAGAMTLPDGFSVQVIASEPVVRQPVAMTIDHRGRVWIAEAYQYPLRADGDVGKDRVLILEDTNGDGTLDSHKIFADNLNLVSGIEVGLGGLWVGAAPYLLFIPDKDGNDVADGPAIKKLEGWGYQDTHETLNSFIWGPDGWLYGCHGVFTHSDVRVVKSSPEETKAGPSTKINAGIWRYHPQSESFEVFAHGTSNPWGVDFNDTGDAFLTACVIPHLYHIIPQARYQRQAGQHFNPFTYSDIQTIALHRHWIGDTPHSGNNRSDSAGGGHAHSGAMFYLGGSWPEKYRNQLFMNNIHGARINQDKIARRGSGYVGDRAPDFLLANDLSSQILYFRSGPDGQVIAIDWYDAQQCHVKDPSKHDQSNGRVYRITYNNAKPVQVDLSKASDLQLVEHQTNKNDWYVRTARRLLMERQHLGTLSTNALSELGKLLKHAEPRIRLRGLWALAACSSMSQADIDLAIHDQDEHVRGWGVRLLSQPATSFQKQHTPDSSVGELASMAANDPSALVRCELAAASHRLPIETANKIVEQLVTHTEDNSDHNLPWMVWYATSRVIEETPKASIDLLGRSKIEKVSEYIARQVSQTYVAKPDERNSETFVSLLSKVASHPVPETAAKWMDSILVALESKRTLNAPTGWPQVSKELL